MRANVARVPPPPAVSHRTGAARSGPKKWYWMARKNTSLLAWFSPVGGTRAGAAPEPVAGPSFHVRSQAFAVHDTGVLGDSVCCFCDALLFPDEAQTRPMNAAERRAKAANPAKYAEDIRNAAARARAAGRPRPRRAMCGKACCSCGQVVLPPMRTAPAIEALYRAPPPLGTAFRKYARRLNNAVAFASEYTKMRLKYTDGMAWSPDYMLCGRLHHRIGPLVPTAGNKRSFAQLWVHDPFTAAGVPTGHDTSVEERLWHLNSSLSKTADDNIMSALNGFLQTLEAELERVNPYVADFRAVAEILRDGTVTDATFCIDADRAPKDAAARLYNNPSLATPSTGFSEVSVFVHVSSPRSHTPIVFALPSRSWSLRLRTMWSFTRDC